MKKKNKTRLAKLEKNKWFKNMEKNVIGPTMMLIAAIMIFYGMIVNPSLEGFPLYLIFWIAIFGVGMRLWEESKTEKEEVKMEIITETKEKNLNISR